MNYQHKTLASGRWFELSLVEQLANIGSEVERTISWRNKQHADYSHKALMRAVELLDLSLADPKNKTRGGLKELTRLRELLLEYFMGGMKYGSTDDLWRQYFYGFNYAARSSTSLL